jgi:hypothetical protein
VILLKKVSKFILLAIIALLTLMPLSNVQAAQKIKISKSSLTLNVGQVRRLTISGITDRVTWKSSDKSIATVSKKGNVKALSEGIVTITGTINKKTYTCDVTVLPKILTEEEKVQNVTYTTYTTDTAFIMCLKNNNATTTSEILALDVGVSFYNASDELIYKSSPTNSYYHVPSGKEFISVFSLPKENTAPYNYMNYASYKINIKSFGTINYKLDVADKIEVTENIIDYSNYFKVPSYNGKDYYNSISEEDYNKLLAENGNVVKDQRKKLNLIIANNSDEVIDNLRIYVVYYKDGQVVAVDEYRGQLNIGKSTLQKENDYMIDSNNYGYRTTFENTDKYDTYKAIVNYAYVRY